MMRRSFISALALLFALASHAVRVASPQSTPPRDTPAQNRTESAPTARLSGRVLAADNGRPVKRARAFVRAPELPEGRGTLTDDNGAFELTDLPAGRYTLTVSKTGFITLSYGQRRPLQAGTPLQLGNGQHMSGLDFQLPRGSVVAGHVFDEGGDPMPGVMVRLMRYQYAQGERQLVPAGTAQTDDRGAFRVWGLTPGRYYVSAVAREAGPGRGGRGLAATLAGSGGPGGLVAAQRNGPGGDPVGVFDTESQPQEAYAPTYYPGVASLGDARPVTVGIGQELLDIDFNLLLVRTVRVDGIVTNRDGSPTGGGLVVLTPEGTGGRGQMGAVLGGRIAPDGTFLIANVPPGRYTLSARGNDRSALQYAVLPLTVGDGDVHNVGVVLYPGATVNGRVTFEGPDAPALNQVRIAAPTADPGAMDPSPNARVDLDGRFTLEGVSAGAHWIRSGPIRGWALKSVIVDGRDVVDTPIELASGQVLSDVLVTFTSRLTEISGTITNEQLMPVTDVTVLAFPTDSTLWRPQSRYIMTARPDQNGRFQMRGLPPGDYYVSAVDPAEQGEWFEPTFLEAQRRAASRLTLGEGDVKTADFRVPTR